MNGKIFALLLMIYFSVYSIDLNNLYTDHKALRTGDLLTILILEDAKAGSQSSTSTDKTHGYGIQNGQGSGSLRFIPTFGASGELGMGYEGKGGTSRRGNLVAKIAARVDRVLDNGNLVISGSKIVEINEEKEIIKITGEVRPGDIISDNVVYSYNIADAEITYSGKGDVSQARRPGLIARFFNWIF